MMQSRISDVIKTQGQESLSLAAFKAAPVDSDKVANLRADNARLTLELNQMRLRLLELERAADTDPLVPVYNRRAFMREVEKAKTVMARYDILSSVIFFDLNGFKSINDRYGHSIGDEWLRKVGAVLMQSVRSCDLVARLGGDEFGVLLFKSSPEETRAKAAALACRIAEQCVDMPTGKVCLSTAWGVAPCDAEDTAEQILARADRAMYVAKRQNA